MHARHRLPALAAIAIALSAAVPAGAQTSGSTPSTGELDVGVRVTAGLDDVGRFQRFADPRTGPTLDRLRYTRDRDEWTFDFAIDHAGYRDQRYAASFERYGKVKASFVWDAIPLWYGGRSSSPFREAAAGVFRLDDGIRGAVEAGAGVSAFASALQSLDVRSRRDVATASLVYSATPELDLSATFRSTRREGSMPWSASFGFNNAIELPVTVDHRTNDITTAAEWSNRKGMFRVAYHGSFFANAVDTLVWDNPLRLTDSTNSRAYIGGDASSQGRMPLWPDSSSHTVSATGSAALPARSRATAYVSVGSWLQDAPLVAHTINSAIASIPLPRDSADAEARIVSMLYRITSRPTPMVWLSAQYRSYDYDNRTPHFAVDDYVRLDGNVATSATGGSEPFDLTRHFFDVDASFTPLRFVAFRAGYARQADDRTYRFFETTVEHTVRVSADATAFSWGSARVQYDHSKRTGEGFDEQVLSDIGEQVSLRQFDISDRDRDRVSATVQVIPVDALGVSASVAVGRERRPDAAFGLQDNDLLGVSVGLDVVPSDLVDLSLSYGYENYSTLQRSRQPSPGPQFDDPTRDWSTDMDEDVHTWTASLRLPQVTDRTSVLMTYDFVRDTTQYLYLLPADTTLPPVEQLPALRNDFHRASADLEYELNGRVALGIGYRLDRWVTHDFALGAATEDAPLTLGSPLVPGLVNTQYLWVPYDVHQVYARLRYRW